MSSAPTVAQAPHEHELDDVITTPGEQLEEHESRGMLLQIALFNRPLIPHVCLCAETQTLSSITVHIPGGSSSATSQLLPLNKEWCRLRVTVPVVGLPTDKRRPFSAQISALSLAHYTCSSDAAHLALCFDKTILQAGACNSLPATPITLELPPGYYNAPIPLQLYRNDDFLRLGSDEALKELRYSAYSTKEKLLSELQFNDATGKLVSAYEKSALVDAWRQNSRDLTKITKTDAEAMAARAENEMLQRRRACRVYPHELTGELFIQRGDDGNVPKCSVYLLFVVVIRELYAEVVRPTAVRM